MHIKSFEIQNFKGIKYAKIELPVPGKNSIVTLIGLNESGKTTILEAISNFVSGDDSISALFSEGSDPVSEDDSVPSESEIYQYVPKDQKANFTDDIKIIAQVELTHDDIIRIEREIGKSSGTKINVETFPRNIKISRAYKFENSKYIENQNLWTISFEAKVGNQRKYRNINHWKERNLWLEVVRTIGKQLPRICFFPTFLFDFPRRIYLIEHENEHTQNKLYRQVIQDVLDSEGSGLNIERHIIDRLKPDTEASIGWAELFQIFSKKDEKLQVDAVLNKMSAHISKVVFGSWNQIFGRRFKNKRIEVQIGIDDEKGDLPYLQFVIYDGSTLYYLYERSLGFRWFFSFLLFTEFRAARMEQSSTVFLFDEPASNLHSKAQLQLLSGFPNITGSNASIIYSTHSLYLIEPKYLENAYIIENLALNFDSEDIELEFGDNETNIISSKYRTFVGENPDRGSYFQPVVDRLNAVNSPVMLPDDVIIMEGKTDFYFMNYYKLKYGPNDISIFPGAGASSSDILISIALGFGRKFVLLADDDAEGRRCVKRYREDFLIGEKAITYADLDINYKGRDLEGFFSERIFDDVKSHLNISKVKKKHLALFFQEMAVTLDYELDSETQAVVGSLFNQLRAELDKQ